MVYCDALPFRKPIPADRVAQLGHCSCGDFENCPIYLEAVARLQKASEEPVGPERVAVGVRWKEQS